MTARETVRNAVSFLLFTKEKMSVDVAALAREIVFIMSQNQAACLRPLRCSNMQPCVEFSVAVPHFCARQLRTSDESFLRLYLWPAGAEGCPKWHLSLSTLPLNVGIEDFADYVCDNIGKEAAALGSLARSLQVVLRAFDPTGTALSEGPLVALGKQLVYWYAREQQHYHQCQQVSPPQTLSALAEAATNLSESACCTSAQSACRTPTDSQA